MSAQLQLYSLGDLNDEIFPLRCPSLRHIRTIESFGRPLRPYSDDQSHVLCSYSYPA